LRKLALVTIPIDPNMNSISVSFSEFPLSNIAISLRPFPHPRTMPQPTKPLAFIVFSIRPLIFPNSFWLSIHIVSLVNTSILELLMPFAIFKIAFPVAFKDSIIPIEHDTRPMPFSIDYFTIIG
jgi:hypothetical protein